jgi:phosphoribosylanthranilate isomerase
VIKVISIAGKADIAVARKYEAVADWLLFDAKPDALPGGNGLTFDWQIIAGEKWTKPWFLSGGLNPANVADAVRTTRTHAVDVSSGVEATRGNKDVKLIESFVASARLAFAESHLQ